MSLIGNIRETVMGQVVERPRRRRKSSSAINGKVPPRRLPNRATRTREYLTSDEVERLVAAASNSGRHGNRDQTLLTLTYRHGLRVSEAVSMRWDQVDLKAGLLHVNRLKNGVSSTHPLRGPEIRRLRQLRRDWPDSPYLFASERGGPMTASNVRKLVAKAGRTAAPTLSSPSSHVAPCVRFQACERRPRYSCPPTLFGAQEHRAYCALHGNGAG